jgi:hypothetical protein
MFVLLISINASVTKGSKWKELLNVPTK